MNCIHITCPNCNKIFEVESKLIPSEGREVRCYSCENIWYYKSKENNDKIHDINIEITKIEEKDGALRSYAGMPIIDKDIRKLGIGGSVLKPPVFSDNLLPFQRQFNQT